jgi:hypothetical protein
MVRDILSWSSEMRFHFIEDRRADYPVTIMCDVLGIMPGGRGRRAREPPPTVSSSTT